MDYATASAQAIGNMAQLNFTFECIVLFVLGFFFSFSIFNR